MIFIFHLRKTLLEKSPDQYSFLNLTTNYLQTTNCINDLELPYYINYKKVSSKSEINFL